MAFRGIPLHQQLLLYSSLGLFWLQVTRCSWKLLDMYQGGQRLPERLAENTRS